MLNFNFTFILLGLYGTHSAYNFHFLDNCTVGSCGMP
jgi:hypothetical protein